MNKFKTQTFQSKDNILVIRPFEIKDLQKLRPFFAQAAEETNHTLLCKEKETPEERLREKVASALQSSSEIYLGVFDDTKIIASLQFRVSIPNHPWVKHIGEFGMLVLREYWEQGIATKLLEIMEDFATSIGVKRIESKVRLNNVRGIALYQKRGFKIEGIRERGALINGKYIDEYFIAKLLNL